jgi:hypothetical protein
MKLVLSLLILFAIVSCFSDSGFAQSSRNISYQGMLTDASGRPAEGEHIISVSLYSDREGEHPVWSDSYATKIVAGVYTINLGSAGVALPSPMPDNLWLGIKVGKTPEMRPLTALSTVPYALHADVATSLSGGAVTNINGASGEIIFKGGAGLNIETKGNTITLNAVPLRSGRQDPQVGSNVVHEIKGTANQVLADGTSGVDQHDEVILSLANHVHTGELTLSSMPSNTTSASMVVSNGGRLETRVFSSLVGTITAADLGTGSVSTDEIEDNSITSDDLDDGSVGTGEIEDNSITSDDLDDGSVGTGEIEDNSITSDDLDDGSVGTGEIEDNSITSDDLDDGSVGTGEIEDNSISSDDLGDGSVGSGEIENGSITADDLGTGSVTSDEIGNGTIIYVDFQDVQPFKLLGNPTPSVASMSEISLGSGLEFDGPTLQAANVNWLLSGNAGTTPGTNYLGTSDETALHLYVNGNAPNINNSLILNTNGSIQRGDGYPRGIGAVDLQMHRLGLTQVASGDNAVISGGEKNMGDGRLSTIGGGSENRAGSELTTVGGGEKNIADGFGATISGGVENNIHGDFSAIPGGRGLRLFGGESFGFHAGPNPITISNPNTAFFGNVNLWLGNNDGSPRELRFYEAYSGPATFPGPANYVGFKAPASLPGDRMYTLPNDYPFTNNQMLVSTTGGVLSWATVNVGTVTSVGLSMPSIFTVTGSPVTTSGTLAASLISQGAHVVFAGPISGTSTPSFRVLEASDIPALNYLTPINGVQYNVAAMQNTAVGGFLFNVGYSTMTSPVSGAMINSTTTGSNMSATGLTILAQATGTATAMGLQVTANSGTGLRQAINAIGRVNIDVPSSYDIGGISFIANGGNESHHNTFLGNTTNGTNSINSTTTHTGWKNTFVGKEVGAANSLGNLNTAMGYRSFYSNTSGTSNSAYGSEALYNNTSGAGNTATGTYALRANTASSANVAYGVGSLSSNDGGTQNTAVGYASMQSNTTGSYNIAVGSYTGGSATTQTGSKLTFLGYSADVAVDGLTNATAIGAQATVGASNCLVLGSIAGINLAASSTKVGIGDNTPASLLTVGASDAFQINNSGDIVKIKGVTYSWPPASATSNGQVLSSTTSGNLSWTTLPTPSLDWTLSGNSGTTAGTNFLGTTDNSAFEIHVFNSNGSANDGTGRVWRVEPSTGFLSSPNIIAGFQGNTIGAGIAGATISGGGTSGAVNEVTDNFGVVGGGAYNTASEFSVVSGGAFNLATGAVSSVLGGNRNTASAHSSFIGGGESALADKYGQFAHAAGAFGGVQGSAQTSVYVVRAITSDASWTDLFLNPGVDRMTITPGSVWKFNVLIVATTSTGALAGTWELSGGIKNVGGTTSLMGLGQLSAIKDAGAALWHAIADADNTNDALVIRVTGAASTQIRWVARVETVEVIF